MNTTNIGEDHEQTLPFVTGLQCPACKSTGFLFVGNGGYLTCSVDTCPNSDYVAALAAQSSTDSNKTYSTGELDKIIQNLVDKVREYPTSKEGPYAVLNCKAEAKAAIQQIILEARIDEHQILDEYLGSEHETVRGKRRIIFVEDIPVRADTIRATLTPKEDA